MSKNFFSRGFTLVELVVVILLLAILTATLLPRFLDTSDKALEAKMSSLRGSLSSAIAMYHPAWQVAQTQGAMANLSTYGLGELDANIADATIALNFANNAEVCQFIALDSQSVQPGTPKPTIFYDTRSGSVLLDLDRVF